MSKFGKVQWDANYRVLVSGFVLPKEFL
ncbi:hypothetical protein DESC_720428 [Desulfosarcina cetonica]|nr:hypothetical protein DESC_720428 [Desulfosarcina cetonica]